MTLMRRSISGVPSILGANTSALRLGWAGLLCLFAYVLLGQIPSTTLADMSAPKNGFEEIFLVVAGAALLGIAGESCLPRPWRPRFERWHNQLIDFKPLLLALFVALFYPHTLVWICVIAVLIGSKILVHGDLPADERSPVITILGFGSTEQTNRAKPRNVTILPDVLLMISVVLAAACQSASLWSVSGNPPTWLYHVPLFAMMLSLAWAMNPKIRALDQASGQ
jgi:hypothetical protein